MSYYSSVILGDNPVGYWRFGEPYGSTTALDQTVNANNGTYTGGVYLQQRGAMFSDGDTCALFDGTSGYVSVPGTPLDATFTGNFSLEGWFRSTGPLTSNAQYMMSKDSGANITTYLFVDSINILFVAGTAAAYTHATVAGVWYYVVGTYAAPTGTIYLNGVIGNSATLAGPTATPGVPMILGAQTDPTLENFMVGYLDELAIYGYALTAAQVSNHYQAGITTLGRPPLVSGAYATSRDR